MYKYMRMMMWSDFVGYVSRVSKSIHTTLYHSAYIDIFEIISAIMADHKH